MLKHVIQHTTNRLMQAGLAIAFGTTLLSAPGHAQSILLDQLPAETICSDQEGFPADHLTDGDLQTLWRTSAHVAPCHFVYRFDEPIALAAVTLHNRYGKGAGVPSRRYTLWASHQSFGRGYYRIAHDALNDEGATRIVFDEPILMRTLKVAVENSEPFSGQRLTASLAEIEIETVEPALATRWPQPRLPAFADGDPVTPQSATVCDELAAHPFNPDSYGYGRFEADVDVAAALSACQAAVIDAPQSMRLVFQLARMEALAEQTVQSVARLASPLLTNYPPAQHELARAFHFGWGVERNQERAQELFETAATADYGPALEELARQAENAYELAVLEGDEAGQEEFGPQSDALLRALEIGYLPAIGYLEDYVLRTDPSQLFALMPQLEEISELHLAYDELTQPLYNNEHGIPNDRHRAIRWIRESALTYPSPGNLGNLSIGERETLHDGELGRFYARLGSYSGDGWPLRQLAISSRGAAAERINAFAFRQSLSAAQAGEEDAMFEVAQLYIDGAGVEQDREEGARWMRLAAASGEPRAITYLQNNSWARDQ